MAYPAYIVTYRRAGALARNDGGGGGGGGGGGNGGGSLS
jgi:hypothetical protein